MNTQNIFELIRKEDVVLWVGAGLSIYAGYPSGSSLGQTIYESLTASEKSVVNSNLPLADLTEEFCNLKGGSKNALIKTLKNLYETHPPSSTQTHDIIASIPHFKTIVTTNYDRLFEIAYKGQITRCVTDVDIPYIDKQVPHLFKIHGDLSIPESIVISTSDYNEFIAKKSQSMMWSVLQERIATKNILFVGYSLSDPNVSMLFDKVHSYLGKHKKEMFLISRSAPPHRVARLSRQGIQYIKSSGEDFFKQLKADIDNNIVTDFNKGYVSPETFNKYLSPKDIIPVLSGGNIGGFKLSALKSKNQNLKGALNFKLKKKEQIRRKFEDIISGKEFGNIAITEDDFSEAKITLAGLKLLSQEDGLTGLNFSSVPKVDTTLDISFEDGFELYDIPIKIFASLYKIEIEVKYKGATLNLSSTKNGNKFADINLKFHAPELYKKSSNGIKIYGLLKRLVSGNSFTCSLKDKDEVTITSHSCSSEELISNSDTLLKYFKNLRIIEKKYSVQFRDIKHLEINEEALTDVIYLSSIIEQGFLKSDWDVSLEGELIDNPSAQTLNEIKNIETDEEPLTIISDKPDKLVLHGEEILLGYREVEIINPCVKNLEDIISGKEKVFIVLSKSKKISIKYLLRKEVDS